MSSLCTITDHLDTQYDASSLISSMASVRQNLLLKYGKPLQLTLQACDVKGKEDKSGPENLLVEPWTRDGFLTETGKTRASTIFSTGSDSAFQVTQIRIMVITVQSLLSPLYKGCDVCSIPLIHDHFCSVRY